MRALTADRPKAAAIVDLPQWCTDNAFTGWWFIRTAGCEITGRRLTVTNINTGTVIGTMDYLQLVYVYTSTTSHTFAQQIELYPYSIVGAAAGATAQGTATYSGTDGATLAPLTIAGPGTYRVHMHARPCPHARPRT